MFSNDKQRNISVESQYDHVEKRTMLTSWDSLDCRR